jgi:hypothetical protein
MALRDWDLITVLTLSRDMMPSSPIYPFGSNIGENPFLRNVATMWLHAWDDHYLPFNSVLIGPDRTTYFLSPPLWVTWSSFVVISPYNWDRSWVYCHLSGVSWLIITGSGLDDWIYWHLYIYTVRDYSNYSSIAYLHTLQFTVAHALGYSVFISRILGTDLSQSHCNFKFITVSL